MDDLPATDPDAPESKADDEEDEEDSAVGNVDEGLVGPIGGNITWTLAAICSEMVAAGEDEDGDGIFRFEALLQRVLPSSSIGPRCNLG